MNRKVETMGTSCHVNYSRVVIALALAIVLGGCAFGRTYSYTDVPIALGGVSSSGTMAVGVLDKRPYVTSGSKPDKFVGLMRGGFGNPFDVNTASGAPLAVEARDALVKSLKNRGISVTPVTIGSSATLSGAKQTLLVTKSRRLVLVTLSEWKSDTYMQTALLYDIEVEVMDEGGNSLATNQIKGKDNLGNLGLTPDAGVASGFASKFDQLFDNEKILAALK
jgi:hypothetical protein